MSVRNDEISLQIVSTLRSIAQEIDTYSRELWVQFGVTAPQIGVLRFLSIVNIASVTEVCVELSVTQQTMAGILQRLEARGLVSRQKDSLDRRKVLLSLTEKGRTISRSLPNLLRDQFMERLMSLSISRRQALLDNLLQLSQMLDVESPQHLPFLFTDPTPNESEVFSKVPSRDCEAKDIEQTKTTHLPGSRHSGPISERLNFIRTSKPLEIY